MTENKIDTSKKTIFNHHQQDKALCFFIYVKFLKKFYDALADSYIKFWPENTLKHPMCRNR